MVFRRFLRIGVFTRLGRATGELVGGLPLLFRSLLQFNKGSTGALC